MENFSANINYFIKKNQTPFLSPKTYMPFFMNVLSQALAEMLTEMSFYYWMSFYVFFITNAGEAVVLVCSLILKFISGPIGLVF